VDNKVALKRWLTDSLNRTIASGKGIETYINEKNQKVTEAFVRHRSRAAEARSREA
jgi:hypothetical protein